jgi:antitoxin MazE
MITKVQKWGNSLGVRIPRAVAEDAELQAGASVDLRFEDGRVVIVPVKKKFTLKELASKITAKNRHTETDWGPAVGNEVW